MKYMLDQLDQTIEILDEIADGMAEDGFGNKVDQLTMKRVRGLAKALKQGTVPSLHEVATARDYNKYVVTLMVCAVAYGDDPVTWDNDTTHFRNQYPELAELGFEASTLSTDCARSKRLEAISVC